jgi:hypothetical protein
MLQRSTIPADKGRGVEQAHVLQPATNTVAAFMLFAVIALAPLPFGSVDALPIVVWCMILGIALCAASLRALDRRHFLILAGIAIVVGAYGLVLHEQLAARPWFSVVAPDPVWQAAADALGPPLAASLSVVRDQPLWALPWRPSCA